MAPSTAQVTNHLRTIIWYHLDNNLLDNALFFAERLHALDQRNTDSIHLLSLCHFRRGQLRAAYDYSRSAALRSTHLNSSYLFAQCCLALDLFSEGITALEKSRPLWDCKKSANVKSLDPSRRNVPDAAAFYCLLGKLLHASGELKRATDCYAGALRINPFMWDAFERLCDTGASVRTLNIFKENAQLWSLFNPVESSPPLQYNTQVPEPHDIRRLQSSTANISTPGTIQTGIRDPLDESLTQGQSDAVPRAFSSNRSQMELHQPDLISQSWETPQGAEKDEKTPVAPGLSRGPTNSSYEPPNAPLRKARAAQTTLFHATAGIDSLNARPITRKNSAKNAIEVDDSEETMKAPTAPHKRTISGGYAYTGSLSQPDAAIGAQRRSGRTPTTPPYSSHIAPNAGLHDVSEVRKVRATGTRGRSAATSTVGRVVSGNRKPLTAQEHIPAKESKVTNAKLDIPQPDTKQQHHESITSRDAISWLLDLLAKFGAGYYALSRYQCQTALQHFNATPPQQRDTPWVLAQIGKAYYELSEYEEAEKVFKRVRKLVPSRTEDMEIYSTCLWHLKDDTELAFLSHELVGSCRFTPEAWCTLGNSFALQRDHDQALRCFKRATQLRPSFAYAYTLQGHEHFSNEEYEKALQAYRKAVKANPRHYNGWFGIGQVYERIGKYPLAEKHYRAAASINPANAILTCYVGTILDRQSNYKAALAQYDIACNLAPRSSLSRFKRARALLRLRRYQESLAEFLTLKDMAPDEANVHFMLGRVYKALRDKGAAIKHFTTALNLDPKAQPCIKEAMEALDDDDVSDLEDEAGERG